MAPLVTVLMPIYNGKKHVREAIESILGQTFENFDFLIMDDGSTDGSQDIIASYTDRRIKLHTADKNQGIARTLNHGIALAQGSYIARMDADDISMPERLEKQVDFMENHPEVGLLGSGVMKIKKSRKSKAVSWPTTDAEIKIDLLFQNPFFHPSIMARTQLLKHTGYDLTQPYAQDYGLWVALAPKTNFANLCAPLLKYRAHEGQVTKTKGEQQAAIAREIRKNYLGSLFPGITIQELATHNAIAERNRTIDLSEAQLWLEKLVSINKALNRFPEDIFETMIARKWWNCCKNNTQNGVRIWKAYRSSNLSHVNIGASKHVARYLIKALFR